MRAVVTAGGVALIAAVVVMMAGQNEPAQAIVRRLAPARPVGGVDMFVMDRYFIFDPVLFVLNVIILGGVTYAIARLVSRLRPAQDTGAGA